MGTIRFTPNIIPISWEKFVWDMLTNSIFGRAVDSTMRLLMVLTTNLLNLLFKKSLELIMGLITLPCWNSEHISYNFFFQTSCILLSGIHSTEKNRILHLHKENIKNAFSMHNKCILYQISQIQATLNICFLKENTV